MPYGGVLVGWRLFDLIFISIASVFVPRFHDHS